MEYLFKGKRADNGEWIQGYLFKSWDDCYICWGTDNGKISNILVIPETIGQYTGLVDKNGIKVFEGDIVRTDEALHDVYGTIRFGNAKCASNSMHQAFYIEWQNDGANMWGDWRRSDLNFWAKQIVVVNNIHDNPELLGAE